MLSAAQCRAARALIEWSRDRLAEASSVEAEAIRQFESKFTDLDASAKQRLRAALESGGAVFISEENGAGEGVRLKFSRPAVRAIERWEGEGGTPGEDDV